jgi:hypothetical protein
MPEVFYMTFGCGQPLEGRALPLIANDEHQARSYMVEYFNSHWCGTYTAQEWQKNIENLRSHGWPVEQELPTIDITNWVPKEVESSE